MIGNAMNASLCRLAALLVAGSFPVHAVAAGAFDGRWKVSMRCPPTDVAKGYAHRFTAEVRDSVLRADYGKPGEPGWQSIRGELAADGSATLRGEGIVGNSDYAARNSPVGKPFSYDIEAKFDTGSGSGQRITGRTCDFQFSR